MRWVREGEGGALGFVGEAVEVKRLIMRCTGVRRGCRERRREREELCETLYAVDLQIGWGVRHAGLMA